MGAMRDNLTSSSSPSLSKMPGFKRISGFAAVLPGMISPYLNDRGKRVASR
jgi:hypothetical protein